MRPCGLLFPWLLSFLPLVWAQPPPLSKMEKVAILRVKNQLASSFDQNLPKVTLDYFLRSEGRGSPITWEVNDCGEQSGNPNVDRRRDIPMCVKADFDVKNQGAVSVVVLVGTSQKGMSGTPTIFSIAIIDISGRVRSVKSLGNLPMELQRPPVRTPRDLPTPVG